MSDTIAPKSAPKSSKRGGKKQDSNVEELSKGVTKIDMKDAFEAICSHVPANRMGYGCVTIFKDPPVTMVVQETGYACTNNRSQRCAALLAAVQADIVNPVDPESNRPLHPLMLYTNGDYAQITSAVARNAIPGDAFMRAIWNRAHQRGLGYESKARRLYNSNRVPLDLVPLHGDAVDTACLKNAYSSAQMILRRMAFDLNANQQTVRADELLDILFRFIDAAPVNENENENDNEGAVEGKNEAKSEEKDVTGNDDVDTDHTPLFEEDNFPLIPPEAQPADIYAFCAANCTLAPFGSGCVLLVPPTEEDRGRNTMWQQRAMQEKGRQNSADRAYLRAALLAVAYANQADPSRKCKLHVFMEDDTIQTQIQTLLVYPPREDTEDLVTEIKDLSRRRRVYWQPIPGSINAQTKENQMNRAIAAANRAHDGNEAGLAVAVRAGYR